MTTLKDDIIINADPTHVWEVLADLGGIVNFHPHVTNSYYTTEALRGTEAGRVCEFNNGMTIDERAVAWEEGRSMTLAISFLEGPTPPLENVTGTLSVTPHVEGAHVEMVMQYDTKMGPIGALMDAVMIRRQYEKMIPSILLGLKHHAETGEVVDDEVFKQLSATPA